MTAVAASAVATAGDATMAGAVVATALPFVLTGGQLHDDELAGLGQRLHRSGDAAKHLLVQSAGDPKTFLDVTIYQSDGQTSIGGNETGGPVHASTGPWRLPALTTWSSPPAPASTPPTAGMRASSASNSAAASEEACTSAMKYYIRGLFSEGGPR